MSSLTANLTHSIGFTNGTIKITTDQVGLVHILPLFLLKRERRMNLSLVVTVMVVVA